MRMRTTVRRLPAASLRKVLRIDSDPQACDAAEGWIVVDFFDRPDQGGGSVSVIDMTTMTVVKTIRVGEYPEGVGADPSGASVYVACWSDNTLERIDAATLEVTARVKVGDGPRAFGSFLRR